MSSRALRRLREEKEAALAAAAEEDDDESSEEEDDDGGGGKGGGFMMMLEEESSSEEESESDSENESERDNSDDGQEEKEVVKSKNKGANNNKPSKPEKEEEEDLDAILSDMNIQSGHDDDAANDSAPAVTLPTIRSLLLSKQKGFDVQDLDLDYAMRSLLGGAAAAGGGDNLHMGDDLMGGGGPQQQNQGRRGRSNNQRGRRTLAKKYLFGKPKNEWGKPPSYVGGGIGTKELTTDTLEEERHNWSVPWPYNLGSENKDDENGDTDTNNNIPTIPPAEQKWFTLQMSDTYQENNYVYQEMLSSQSSATRAQGGGAGGMHDPNSLAMFVADHPYFAETILQLAMVLYYINDRGRGNDLLRRCMFLYEAALPSNVLPNNNNSDNDNGEISGGGSEILIDIDRQPNSGLFATLFRIMQTSGMTGCHNNALAAGRFLLSLDPLRDPMGVLLILDYYALASRRTSTAYRASGEEVEVGAAFIVDLIESGMIKIHYKDPLTDRHHWCRLIDMPNWAYSYALALYRLSIVEDDDSEERYQERAEEELMQALEKFPMALPKLLDMNNVNTRDRSFRMDWPAILPHFSGDAIEGISTNGTVEERVTRASGEHMVRIFVQRCHKFWKEDHVVQWMFNCAAKLVNKRQLQQNSENEEDVKADGASVAANGNEQTAPPSEDVLESAADAAPVDTGKKDIPPLISTFSPALARYAQCDPSEYEDAFRTFPPDAIALDPNIVAPAMALGPNGRQRRMFRRNQPQQQQRGGGRGGADGDLEGRDALDVVRQMLGMGGNEGGEVDVLDPDSPLLQLYLQSLLPWAQVEGVRPPPRG